MVPKISIVLPVYNERENLDTLVARLLPVLEKTVNGSFEVLFVDDGSCDGSTEILDRFSFHDQRLKTIQFSRAVSMTRFDKGHSTW